ncbi:restriction endonuclease subunit S [Xanthomonas oryzae]|uniref:restriction endonuclease subunit S n=1 Tax=Xanthomonas oryzae TaxID=347 RepID=UPI0009B4FF4E|nr:restriction endonuclease subunit S [Xanthomonas oryzae]QBO03208.1 type I restriction endonuclease subunit S [Xanthomonas oryzae pv. oryzae]
MTSTQQTISKNGLDNSAAKLVPANALLVAMYGSIGKLAITGIECATNQAIAFCVPDTETIALRYLFYSILQSRNALNELGQGAGQQNISQTILKEFKIPLAPLAEQKRIAQKLDALLAQVDTLKARIDAIPALLKRFRESALSAAVSGRLTKSHDKTRHLAEPFRLNDGAQPASAEEISQAIEVTGEPFPDQWTIYALEQIVDGERGIPYGIVQTGDPVAEGVSTVRCGDVRHLRIDTTALKVVARDIEKNYARTRLKGGEVLLAIRGSIGNTAVAPKSLANCNISREVAMIPCIEDVDSMFVALVLQSKRGQQLLAGKTRGVAQKGINLADVRRLPIALPSRTTQREIVRRVEQLFAYADQLEAKVTAAQQRIDALTQSLLAKAFRGELVPQDPSDEPASALLERIRTQRAATPKPKRGRKAATS